MTEKPYPAFIDFCIENDKGNLEFKPAIVAQWLKENEHFKTNRENSILYYYNKACGKWDVNGEVRLQEILSELLGEENRSCHYTNIRHALKGLTYEDITFSQKIACTNGLLNVETGELTPFTPEEMTFYSIPHAYNPDIDKTKLVNWLDFLKQVANPEDIPMLQEWMGYALLPSYPYHHALWIHGEGRNGKGVFDRTIKGILGVSNVSTVGLERLDGTQRFVLKDLYGKLYNSSSEPVSNKIFQTEIFQKVTGGDLISAEFKGANQEVNFVNSAKMTIIGNKFPKIINPTVAFKDRMLFVTFPNYFDEKTRVADLEKEWLSDPEQCSAILNWMLEGLKRLRAQGYFTRSKNQLETEILFQRVTDTVGAFQKEWGLLDKNMVTTRAEALEAYYQYCELLGVKPVDKSDFTNEMQRLSPKVKDGWVYKPIKERAWLGFGLQPSKTEQTKPIEQIAQIEQHSIPRYLSHSKKYQEYKGVPSVPSVPKAPRTLGSSLNFEPTNKGENQHE